MRGFMRCSLLGFAVVGLVCRTTMAVQIDSGDTVTTTGPIVIDGKHDLVITRCHVTGATDNCLLLRNCNNVLIEDSEFSDAAGEGIHLINCTSVTVSRCRFRDVRTGVYAIGSSGIKVSGNQFRNVQGPMPRGQFIQFNNVTGHGNSISGNIGVNEPGHSNPEDAINIYQSHGTPEDPIRIEDNRIRGGGPSASGGGILVGDSGGSFISVKGNQLVDPGQYGIAVAGGSNVELINNQVYGRRQSFSNVGLYVWNQCDDACSSVTVRNNTVWWLNRDGKPNAAWNAGNCGSVTGWEENNWGTIELKVPQRFPETPL